MHCLQKGFEYTQGEHSFSVDTLDAPVVALGRENSAPILERSARPEQGNPLVPLQQCMGDELHHVVRRGLARTIRLESLLTSVWLGH